MLVVSYSNILEHVEECVQLVNSKTTFQTAAKKTPKTKKSEVLNLLCNAIKGDLEFVDKLQSDSCLKLHSIKGTKIEALCDANGLPLVYVFDTNIRKYRWVIPSFHLLWNWGLEIPCFEVPSAVSTFVLKGAKLMLRGVNILRSMTCVDMLTLGMVVGVRVAHDRHPFAIGLAKTNKTMIMSSGRVGPAMSTLFTYIDNLGSWHNKIRLPLDPRSPISRFTPDVVLPPVNEKGNPITSESPHDILTSYLNTEDNGSGTNLSVAVGSQVELSTGSSSTQPTSTLNVSHISHYNTSSVRSFNESPSYYINGNPGSKRGCITSMEEDTPPVLLRDLLLAAEDQKRDRGACSSTVSMYDEGLVILRSDVSGTGGESRGSISKCSRNSGTYFCYDRNISGGETSESCHPHVNRPESPVNRTDCETIHMYDNELSDSQDISDISSWEQYNTDIATADSLSSYEDMSSSLKDGGLGAKDDVAKSVMDKSLEFLFVESMITYENWFDVGEPTVTCAKVLSALHQTHAKLRQCPQYEVYDMIAKGTMDNEDVCHFVVSRNKISFRLSSYKNIVDFVTKMAEKKYITIRKKGKSPEDVIITARCNHNAFNRNPLKPVSTPPINKDLVKIVPVYTWSGAAKPILQEYGLESNVKKGIFIDPKHVVPALLAYIKKHNHMYTTNGTQSSFVDDVMADVIFADKHKKREFKQREAAERSLGLNDLITRFKANALVARSQLWRNNELLGTLTRPPQKLSLKKVNTRGHKITRISGLASYMIPSKSVAKFLSQKLACSCWDDGPNDVAVQGWKFELVELMNMISEQFGVEFKK